MRKLACGAFVVAVLAIVAPVTAKEGMTATLLRPVALHAKPGTTIRVVWRLGEKSASAASDDDRFYVRLDSASGRGSRRAFGHLTRRHYVATVRVPTGGIGDVRIFLVGWVYYAGGG